jgi:hypothetical protein
MRRRLLPAFRSLSRGVRRGLVASTAILLLSIVVSALRPAADHGHRASSNRSGTASTSTAGSGVQRHLAPVSARDAARARAASTRFLEGYLPFAYGRASAGSVRGITPPLRQQLTAQTASVTPVERERHPKVVALQVAGAAPGVVLATALVEDGGITTYALRITLSDERTRWVVGAASSG